MRRPHREYHAVGRIGWLRAAVLGANDGLLSTSSLIVGVAASGAATTAVVTAGIAGLAAGALSMAAGEYVSVSSQADAEAADLARETQELRSDPQGEHAELTQIYVERGLDPALAGEVARQLMAKDALAAHARDELGITDLTAAKPVQAAFASAASFAAGAILPVLVAFGAPRDWLTSAVFAVTVVLLLVLGALGARTGGASPAKGAIRVLFWGVIAMLVTGLIGRLFGAVV